MVPLDRALVSSYRLSTVTMSLSAAVWPQFAHYRSGGKGWVATSVLSRKLRHGSDSIHVDA